MNLQKEVDVCRYVNSEGVRKSFEVCPEGLFTLMKQKSVVITGCCRNVQSFILNNLDTMHKIGMQFAKYTIVIYENDSQDQTREILRDHQNNHPTLVECIFEDNLNIPLRTERIAYCRNRLLQKVKLLPYEPHYLLMLDLDDVLASGRLVETIHTCFLYKTDQWDAMFANCSDKYYDIYALRRKGHLTTCCWNDANKMMMMGASEADAYATCINRFVVHYPISQTIIPVISAFGGAGLYKYDSIGDAVYCGVEPSHVDKQICEHVPFHQMIRKKNNGKLFINPRMLIR